MYKKLVSFFLLFNALNISLAQGQDVESNYYSFFDRAVLSFEKMDYDEALLYLNKCKEIIPNRISAYLYSAEILIAKKSFSEALKELEVAYKIDTNDYRIFHNKAICYSKLNKHYKAIEELTYIIDKISKEPLFYVERAALYVKVKNKNKACLDFRNALYLGSVTARDSIDKYCKGKF